MSARALTPGQRLLDDLHDGVEDADQSLQTRTKHADKVRKKGGVCWMYCVIVLLVGQFARAWAPLCSLVVVLSKDICTTRLAHHTNWPELRVTLPYFPHGAL